MPLSAIDDIGNITEDAAPNTTTGNVGTNDTGGVGALTVTAVNGQAGNVGQTITGTFGTIRINADGSYTYTLNNSDADTQALRFGQTGIDAFTYNITDGSTSGTATIRINVAGFNDLPSASNDSASVRAGPADVVITGNVLSNDSDRETDATLVVTEVNGSAGNVGNTITGTYGTLTLNADGTYSYTLDVDDPDTQALEYYSAAPEVFTYSMSDGDGGIDTATLTISVSGIDQPDVYEVTPETVVNTTTAGTQDFSASASLASGGYVVTWLDSGTPGNAEIRGQLYNASGAKVGSEFLVNTADAVNQLAPEIVALEGDGFVAVWALEGGGVEAQIFNDAGAKVGAKISVAGGAGEMTPDVGALSNGGFVISWQGQVSGHAEVKTQMYDATGATVGSQILVPSSPADVPLVVGLEGGGFVVAQRNGLAQIYDSDGAKVGAQFSVLTDQTGARSPSILDTIAPLAGGGFVATSTWAVAFLAQYDPGSISGLVFTAEGVRVGDEFKIPEASTGSKTQESNSAIIALADGRFVVTWQVDVGDIRGIIIDAQGNLAGREFIVSDTAGGDTNAAVVALASGDIAFTWTNAADIQTQLFSVLDAGPAEFGTTGNDTMRADLGTTGQFVGLAGNDTYFVDEQSDQVIERIGEGYDTVYSTVSYALLAGSEIEVLSTNNWGGTGAINLTGNDFANTIYGNAGDNLINGGLGADTMTGLGGNDTYFLENAGDVVVEGAGGGFDTGYIYTSYLLGAGVQLEVISAYNWYGTETFNFTGNELDNRLYGNGGANQFVGGNGNDIIIGFGGGDTMTGGAGDEQYFVFGANDVIVETAGNGFDGVYAYSSYTLADSANVEILSTYSWGGTEAYNLTGNNLANSVYGNAGANVLNGGLGLDTLTGWGGADIFAFTTALGAGNIDAIADYTVADDTIQLENAVFTGLAAGDLAAGAFVIGTAAGDADDRIIYNSTTGALLFDADGNGAGAAVQFATLSTGLALTASDFAVI